MLVPMICIGVIFYFLIIRPQSKRQKEHAALVSALKTGDKVITSGGILATWSIERGSLAPSESLARRAAETAPG